MDQLNTRVDLLDAIRQLRADLDAVITEVGEERAVQPGSFGPWTFKDLIAHLTGWRLLTAARLEAGLSAEEPAYPWPAHLEEDEDADPHEINAWFYEAYRDKPLEQVIAESNENFDRVERAVEALPVDALLTPGRFAWISWGDYGLGPAVVRGTLDHFYVDHEPDIRAWLQEA
jgi:hypothetical protein